MWAVGGMYWELGSIGWPLALLVLIGRECPPWGVELIKHLTRRILRRDAPRIRGPLMWVPALRCTAARCTASGTRECRHSVTTIFPRCLFASMCSKALPISSN